jgi:hypothetical protein
MRAACVAGHHQLYSKLRNEARDCKTYKDSTRFRGRDNALPKFNSCRLLLSYRLRMRAPAIELRVYTLDHDARFRHSTISHGNVNMKIKPGIPNGEGGATFRIDS